MTKMENAQPYNKTKKRGSYPKVRGFHARVHWQQHTHTRAQVFLLGT